ncbi:Hypothetical protein NG00_01236 [Corynebacterium camporealensis]|uniref:Uncharacterized protein n=1 Tax=Corynebacterium camporealensis TaxID=161896 RepID=A0A0F6QYL6_9CORY|nr:glycosyltransferase family 87 protein [Corynebacterium camporealensis]AKE39308.1 Protein of unknown function (DUF2029) [Corynebacterium camporealensis]AVH88487.1 Hypothetical protein NG00_01236 [Corynebacterium camporealensis]
MKHDLVRTALWPIAIVLIVHRVFFSAFPATGTDDFTTVYSALRRFWEGVPVYEQAYHHVDPLYLYNPGATLLLSPLGLIGSGAREGFILLNAAAIIGALALLTRIVGHRLSGVLFPMSLALAFASEAVTNTLAFTNINGLLLLALAIFLWGFLRGLETNRTALLWMAGVAIGLAIVVKPQFAPLLFLPLVRLEWRSILVGLGIPVGLNLVAWPLVPGAGGYLENLVPYLGTTRDYANSSWPGVRAYFDAPSVLYWAVWLAMAAVIAAGILLLLRWRTTEPTFWALHTTGILMAGIFFLSSLGQQYYSMWLFPMMFSVVMARSVFHSWGAWLAAFLFLAPLDWDDRWLNTYMPTLGWALLLIVSTVTIAGWWLTQRRGDYTALHD